MKKALIILLVVVLAVVLGWLYLMPKGSDEGASASQVSAEGEKATGALAKNDADADYRIFKSEKGDIKIPKNPQRIAVLSASSMGTILKFGGKVIAYDKWAQVNPLFEERLTGATLVPAEGVEEVMALKPDLIIVSSTNKKYSALSKIAPTISFTYGNMSYLESIITYADLIGKKAEAEAWATDFQTRAKKAGAQIKAKYGENVSISVMEAYGDDIYLFGDNWGRGTQIVYKEMGLKMPDEVKKVALSAGYKSISTEVIPKYSADLMIFCHYKGANTSFLQSETWQNLAPVKAGRVLKVEAEGFYATDAMALENQLKIIKGFFLDGTSASQVSAEDEKATGALAEKKPEAKSEFRAFPSVGGEVIIPKDPKRIFVGLHLYLGVFAQYAPEKIVGYGLHPKFKNDATYKEVLKNAKGTSPNNIEEIMALKPDLIYSSKFIKNNAELAKIAPTIVDETSSSNDYLERNIEIASLLNKKAEAEAWVADFTNRAKKTAEKLRAKNSKNISASVFMSIDDKLFYVAPFGMRGAYLLNHIMGIPMPNLPENMQDKLKTVGASLVSAEILPEITGDLILVCSFKGSNNAFLKTEIWKQLPAVKKGNFLITPCEKFYYVDGVSLEYKLKTIEDSFLKEAKK